MKLLKSLLELMNDDFYLFVAGIGIGMMFCIIILLALIICKIYDVLDLIEEIEKRHNLDD